MQTQPYIPSGAKPKVNVTPSFSGSAAPEVTENIENYAETSRKTTRPVPDDSTVRISGWDMRFAVGLVLAIILVNTALVLLFSYDTPQQLSALPPSAGPQVLPESTAPATPAFSRPAKTTETYITNEQRQLLLRQLNTVPDASETPKEE